jgi:hypothetical protein
VFYFRQLPLIPEIKIVEMLEVSISIRLFVIHLDLSLCSVSGAWYHCLLTHSQPYFSQVLCRCLDDEVVEVREMAAV